MLSYSYSEERPDWGHVHGFKVCALIRYKYVKETLTKVLVFSKERRIIKKGAMTFAQPKLLANASRTVFRDQLCVSVSDFEFQHFDKAQKRVLHYATHLLNSLCLEGFYRDRYHRETPVWKSSSIPRLKNTIVKYTRVCFEKIAKLQREELHVLIWSTYYQQQCKHNAGNTGNGMSV